MAIYEKFLLIIFTSQILVGCSSKIYDVHGDATSVTVNLKNANDSQEYILVEATSKKTISIARADEQGRVIFLLPDSNQYALGSTCVEIYESDEEGSPLARDDGISLTTYNLDKYNELVQIDKRIKHNYSYINYVKRQISGSQQILNDISQNTGYTGADMGLCEYIENNSPKYACSTVNERDELAIGICANESIGCFFAGMALSFIDPYGLAETACSVAVENIMDLGYTTGDFLEDAAFNGAKWYFILNSHPVLAATTVVLEKAYGFYDCQDKVVVQCTALHQNWVDSNQECRENKSRVDSLPGKLNETKIFIQNDYANKGIVQKKRNNLIRPNSCS